MLDLRTAELRDVEEVLAGAEAEAEKEDAIDAPKRLAAASALQAAKAESDAKLPELRHAMEELIVDAPYEEEMRKKRSDALKKALARAVKGVAGKTNVACAGEMRAELIREREWAAAEAAQRAAKTEGADAALREADEAWSAHLRNLAASASDAADVARFLGLLRSRGAEESAKEYALYWSAGCALSGELATLAAARPEVRPWLGRRAL